MLRTRNGEKTKQLILSRWGTSAETQLFCSGGTQHSKRWQQQTAAVHRPLSCKLTLLGSYRSARACQHRECSTGTHRSGNRKEAITHWPWEKLIPLQWLKRNNSRSTRRDPISQSTDTGASQSYTNAELYINYRLMRRALRFKSVRAQEEVFQFSIICHRFVGNECQF